MSEKNILEPSEEELSRLIKAFVATSSMYDRMKVLDYAERMAKAQRHKAA
jgi:hypothetical protein